MKRILVNTDKGVQLVWTTDSEGVFAARKVIYDDGAVGIELFSGDDGFFRSIGMWSDHWVNVLLNTLKSAAEDAAEPAAWTDRNSDVVDLGY